MIVNPRNTKILAVTTFNSSWFSFWLIVTIFSTSQKVQIRQYAAVLLRKKFSKAGSWFKLTPADRDQLKSGCLSCIISEPERSVRSNTPKKTYLLTSKEIGWYTQDSTYRDILFTMQPWLHQCIKNILFPASKTYNLFSKDNFFHVCVSRTAVSQLVGTLARHELSSKGGQWPELFTFLLSRLESQNPQVKYWIKNITCPQVYLFSSYP